MDVRQGFAINSTPSISADDSGMSVSSSGWGEKNQNGLTKREKDHLMEKKLSQVFLSSYIQMSDRNIVIHIFCL